MARGGYVDDRHDLRSIVDAFEHAKEALLASSHPEAKGVSPRIFSKLGNDTKGPLIGIWVYGWESKNRGISPQIIQKIGGFHYKL